MNTTTQGISPLRQRMIEEMCMRQLAPKTREAYIRAVVHFTRYLRRSPDTATAEELRDYQLHCVKQGDLGDHAERHDHGLEVLLRGHPRSEGGHGQDAPGSGAAHLADHLESRGGERA